MELFANLSPLSILKLGFAKNSIYFNLGLFSNSKSEAWGIESEREHKDDGG